MDFESEKLLAAFRGVPHLGTWGGRRKIKSLDGVLDRVIEKCGIEKPSVEQILIDHWRTIVGERFAHRCRPMKLFEGKILHIAAANPTLRQELIFKKSEIVEKIQQVPGCEEIEGISFS